MAAGVWAPGCFLRKGLLDSLSAARAPHEQVRWTSVCTPYGRVLMPATANHLAVNTARVHVRSRQVQLCWMTGDPFFDSK